MRTRLRTTLLAAAAAAAFLIAAPAQAITITEQTTPNAQSGPIGIAAGADGALYVTESGARQIARLTTAGAFTELPLTAADASPQHAARGADGNVWTTDASTAGVVHRVTPAGEVTDFPVPTVAATGGIAAGPDGNVWYTMPTSNRVGHISPTGAALDVALPAAGDNQPASIAAGPDGAMWVTAPGTNAILRVEVSSGNVTSFPIPTASSGPQGIALGPDGALWFAERTAGRIGRITPAGAITEFPVGGQPTAITAGSDGALWFTDQQSQAIWRLTVAGQATRYPLPAGGVPNDLTSGPGGDLWYARSPATVGHVVVPPLPAVGRSADAEVVSGTVTVRLPGAGGFTKLTGDARRLPVGTELDTRAGKVRLTASAGTGTKVTKTSEFYDGRFRIAQAKARDALFTVTLTGPLTGCAHGAGARAAKAKKPAGRGLWGDGKGTFRTNGRHSSATVRGTSWFVQDRCDGTTRTTVKRGVVAVRDFTRQRTVLVRAGQSYTARPRR